MTSDATLYGSDSLDPGVLSSSRSKKKGGGGEERGTGNEVRQLGLLRFEFSAFCFDQPGKTFSLFLDRLALIASPR